jgi:hypothetical protein
MPLLWCGGSWGEHWRFSTSPQDVYMIKVPRAWFDRFLDVICYAASVDKVEKRP